MKRILTLLTRPVVGFSLAAVLLALSVSLIVIGWPETSRLLKAMLQLGGLCLSLSIGAVLLVFLGGRPDLWDRRGFRTALLTATGFIATGVFVYLVAMVSMNGFWAPLGQLLIWFGFGVVAIYLMFQGLDRARDAAKGNRVYDLLDGQESVRPSSPRARRGL